MNNDNRNSLEGGVNDISIIDNNGKIKSPEVLANDVLAKFQLNNKYPILLQTICDKLGIAIESPPDTSGKQLSGKISKKNNQVTIWLNNNERLTRKRFTLAHELGHYYYDLTDNEDGYEDTVTFNRQTGYQDPIETRANQFAACLLMPRAILEERIKFYGVKEFVVDEFNIMKLAIDFKVSWAAMEIRLKSLGYELV